MGRSQAGHRPHLFVAVGVITVIALLLAARALGQPATPQAGEGIATTMGTPRAGHTATLLADGRVLVVGGDNGEIGLTSAEIYETASNIWVATGSMSVSRVSHTATLLRDGRVLVVGGRGSRTTSAPLDTAELYNPATGTFSETASLALPRAEHAATLLADGRVLVTGGEGSPTLTRTTAEIYDPETGVWQAAAPMLTVRRGFVAVLLADGRVLAAGGGADAPNSAEIYDPATNKWQRTTPMNRERVGPMATLLANGQVLVVDGAGRYGGRFTTAEIYDPTARTWQLTANALGFIDQNNGTGASLLRLANGDALLIQSNSQNIAYPNGGLPTQFFDPGAGRWIPAKAITTQGYNYTITLLPDGSVLLAGGVSYGFSVSEARSNALRYTPVALRNQHFLPLVGVPYQWYIYSTPTRFILTPSPATVGPVTPTPQRTATPAPSRFFIDDLDSIYAIGNDVDVTGVLYNASGDGLANIVVSVRFTLDGADAGVWCSATTDRDGDWQCPTKVVPADWLNKRVNVSASTVVNGSTLVDTSTFTVVAIRQ